MQGKEEELELEQAYEPRLFVRTALKGVQEPAQLVLPLVALMHSARTVSCAIQIALDRGVLHSGAAGVPPLLLCFSGLPACSSPFLQKEQ